MRSFADMSEERVVKLNSEYLSMARMETELERGLKIRAGKPKAKDSHSRHFPSLLSDDILSEGRCNNRSYETTSYFPTFATEWPASHLC